MVRGTVDVALEGFKENFLWAFPFFYELFDVDVATGFAVHELSLR